MGAYSKERLDHLVGLVASEFEAARGVAMPQTYLWKFLACFEFYLLAKTGDMPLGLNYEAMKNGPVPANEYDRTLRMEPFVSSVDVIDAGQRDQKTRRDFRAKDGFEFDEEFFSSEELDRIEQLLRLIWNPKFRTRHASMLAHWTIKAWKEAWMKSKNEDDRVPMNLADTFPQIEHKNFEDLSLPEERFVVGRLLSDSSRV